MRIVMAGAAAWRGSAGLRHCPYVGLATTFVLLVSIAEAIVYIRQYRLCVLKSGVIRVLPVRVRPS